MSNGAPFYLSAFPFDGQRSAGQFDSPSSASTSMNGVPGPSNGRSSLDLNPHPAAFPDGTPRMAPQYHQGSTNPYGMQQPSMLPTDFRDGFGTPQSGSSALMMAGTPYTHETTHQGAMTHSPVSLPAHFEAHGSEQIASQEGTKARRDSDNLDNSDEPPKKKKKGKNGEAIGTGSGSGTEDKDRDKEKEKDNRRKTSRACDVCRTKKIRCDILIQPMPTDGSAPAENTSPDHPQGLCKHCKNQKLECTFFMPITETRFKKKREEEQAAAAAAAKTTDITAPSSSRGSIPQRSHASAQFSGVPDDSPKEDGSRCGNAGAGPSQNATRHAPESSMRGNPPLQPPQRKGSSHSQGGRYEGPTSISFLLHSAPSLPRSTIEEFDLRNHQTWQLTTDDGDGLIRVFNPPPTAEPKEPANSPSQGLSGQSVLSSKLISSLINSYFQHVAPLFPIVAKSDFIKGRRPPPLLLYALAGVAATRRGVSRDVFNAIRTIINGIIRNNDVLSDASIENVQALLILGMAADLHAQPVSTAVSASVTRLAAAIRMAQNLGLHRESVASSNDTEEMENIELRRRVWAACVLFDRWCGASLGLPLLIDLQDCDCLVPAPYEFVQDTNPPQWQIVDDPPYSHLAEHLKLSVLMGRVLKCIYSPVGLMHTTNEQLGALINDLSQWQAQLPANLQYTGPDSSLGAGMLHASFTALQFLMWRPFLRLQFTLPKHIKLAMNIATWSKLLRLSHEVIEWLERHEDALDTIYVFAYAISNCALIQYHTWVRRREERSLKALETLRNIVQRWEAALQPDHMSIRRKTIEVMTLLYEAAKKAHKDDLQINSSALNPTTGVKRRHPDMLKKIVWRPDPNQPSHGVFVATDLDPNSELLSDLAPNTLITGTQDPSPKDSQQPANGNTQTQTGAAAANVGTQPINQWANAGGPNGENVTYLHLDPALTYLPDMPELPAPTGEAYDTAMLLNMFDQPGNQSNLNQAALVDQNMLEGLPTGFDWNAWDTYFNRFDGLSTQMGENGMPLPPTMTPGRNGPM
ncbi:hypothetical protein NliqN6_5275 [Naganishia liquefaciens]|uniref:Zn(2)-C6 fungal-type domain-containing protein n=1 Tax=Naganishia liquefaciens TaxID=104408 RepID=A0A8H3TXG1_9TREE|nr:hypothetical protein NliqN6_5275 [Naganishia liquefaciens]